MLVIAAAWVIMPTAHAANVSLEYTGFYERLKRANKGHYPQIELVFSVPKVQGCIIQSGNISTEKRQFPLTYDAQQRVFIPFDSELKTNRGLINIEVDGDGTNCAIAMQVRSKSVQTTYTQAQLVDLMDQMDDLFDNLHGFPMKYFRDPIAGINISFDSEAINQHNQQALSVDIDGKNTSIKANSISLTRTEIMSANKVHFSHTPSIVSPFIQP